MRQKIAIEAYIGHGAYVEFENRSFVDFRIGSEPYIDDGVAHWLGKFSHPEDIRPHAIFYLEK